MNSTFVEEAESFLEQHPDIREFDLLLPDMNAVSRGKRIQRGKLILYMFVRETKEIWTVIYIIPIFSRYQSS